jgi:hypothetical protein
VPYATIGDVIKKAPNITISAQTKPSISDVADYLSDIESEVNAYLMQAGYQVPLTGGPETLKILRDLVAQGALAKTLQAIIAGRGATNDIGQKQAWQIYLSRRDDIAKGKFVLPDEVPAVTVVQSNEVLGFSSNLPEINLDDDTDIDGNPLVTRNQRF